MKNKVTLNAFFPDSSVEGAVAVAILLLPRLMRLNNHSFRIDSLIPHEIFTWQCLARE